jgi:uncharacterized membrane protein YeaQ/YmgE (transglycosylase-associated protein family)
MSDFIGWIVLGLVAGGLAKFLLPGDQKGGCLMTIILGIAGAVVGGFLAKYLTFLPSAKPIGMLPSIGSIITGTLGAFILLLIFSKKAK